MHQRIFKRGSELVPKEGFHRFRGVVFFLAQQAYKVRSMIRFESKRLASQNLLACNGRADVFFYMLNNQIGSGNVRDVRPAKRVVHGVSQVSYQYNILSILGHLP